MIAMMHDDGCTSWTETSPVSEYRTVAMPADDREAKAKKLDSVWNELGSP
jgi:hypothetical protein